MGLDMQRINSWETLCKAWKDQTMRSAIYPEFRHTEAPGNLDFYLTGVFRSSITSFVVPIKVGVINIDFKR